MAGARRGSNRSFDMVAIRRMRDAGLTWKEIAKHLNTDRVTLRRHCDAHGGFEKEQPRTAKEMPSREALETMRDKDMSVAAIAKVYGVASRTVVVWLAKYDLSKKRLKCGPKATRPAPAADNAGKAFINGEFAARVRRIRTKPAPAGTDLMAMINAAVANGQITKCPTRFCAPTQQVSA